MTWRRIGVYYGLAILFGSYFVFFLWDSVGEGPKARGLNTAVQSRFLPFSEESIHKLQLQREGQVITCQKNGKIWQVLEPQGANVTSSLVSSLIESLTLERETSSVNENADDLTLYGLEPPHATIVLTGKDEQGLATILIGGRNPTSTAVYVKKEGSSQVVLLGYNARYYEELLFEAATGATLGIGQTPEPLGTNPETVAVEPTIPAAPGVLADVLDSEVVETPVDAASDATTEEAAAPQIADTSSSNEAAQTAPQQSTEEAAEELGDSAPDTTTEEAAAPHTADTPSRSEAAPTVPQQSAEPEQQQGQ